MNSDIASTDISCSHVAYIKLQGPPCVSCCFRRSQSNLSGASGGHRSELNQDDNVSSYTSNKSPTFGPYTKELGLNSLKTELTDWESENKHKTLKD